MSTITQNEKSIEILQTNFNAKEWELKTHITKIQKLNESNNSKFHKIIQTN